MSTISLMWNSWRNFSLMLLTLKWNSKFAADVFLLRQRRRTVKTNSITWLFLIRTQSYVWWIWCGTMTIRNDTRWHSETDKFINFLIPPLFYCLMCLFLELSKFFLRLLEWDTKTFTTWRHLKKTTSMSWGSLADFFVLSNVK